MKSKKSKKQTSNKGEKKMRTIKAKEILCETDREITEQDIADRAKSIEGVGLIHSVKIQPLVHDKYKFRVVAGRKSFLALTQILGKDELEIPDEISFIKGDPELIAFAENDERTNLTLAEQIEKLSNLSEKFGIAELASHLSHSPNWIAARIRLKELSERWKNAMKGNMFPDFTIGHYEAVAKYPAEIQEEILDFCYGCGIEEKTSLAKFTKLLEENFTFMLRNAPWNTDGEYKGCGTCPACIDRANNGFLFEDTNRDKDAICQNRKHYFEKLNEFIAGKVEDVRKNEPETILVSQSNNSYPEGFPVAKEEVYPSYAWTKSKKKTGKKALVVNGPMTGKTVYVEVEKEYAGKGNNPSADGSTKPDAGSERKPRSLEERKELKNRQRQRLAIDSLIAFVEGIEYKIPKRDVIYKLIACLGVDSICRYDWQKPENKIKVEGQGLEAYSEICELDELDKAVWQKLVKNIVQNLKLGQSGTANARWNEAGIISSLIDFDLEKAFSEAIEALPDPKSWSKLEENSAGEKAA